MLSITVKTMDSQSRQFEVPASIRIKDFKDTIASSVNVSAGNQRLIYQGRVLQDDFILTEEHNGKVLHLVQRMPTVTTTGSSSSTPATSTNASSSTSNSGTFNPSQLSHMIFQQAMSGLGNLLVGGSISGNMVPNPSDPNEQIMNIQIDLSGPGSNVRGSSSSSTSITSTQSTTNSTSGSQTFRINPMSLSYDHQSSGCSAPRLLLRSADRHLKQLNTVLDQLEALDASDSTAETAGLSQEESIRGVDSSGDVFVSELEHSERADEAMDVTQSSPDESDPVSASTQPQSDDVSRSSGPSTSTATSSAPQPSVSTHPSLAELGTYYTRLQQAQRRLDPFTTQMITFLNTDPSFSSTQAPEYRNAARFLSLALQAQHLMAEIQRLLSRAVIPLGRTPPRTMLVRAAQFGPHQHHRIHADARRLHHAVHAERISLPRGSYFAPSRASSGSFFSPPRPSIGPYFTPFRPSTGSFFPSPRSSNGSLFRPSNSASSTPAPGSSPQQLFPSGTSVRVRWRMPPSTTTSSSANATDSARTTTTSGTTPATSQAPPADGGPTTVFTVQPPTYTVHVNATIQPHIMFNVNPSTSASSQPTSTSGSGPNSASQNRTSDSQASATPNVFSWPSSGAMPNIPGLQTGALSNLFQSIARSTQQQASNAGNSATVGGGGVIVLQGPPGGENQVPEDISNIIGQSVFEAVYNQLTSTSNGFSSSQSAMPNVRVVLSNTSTTTTLLNSASTTTTWTTAAPSAQSHQTPPAVSSSSTAQEFYNAMSVDDASSRLRQSTNDESRSSAGLSRNDQDATSRLIESLQRLMNTTALLGFDWDQNLDALLPARMTDSANQPASGSRAVLEVCQRFPCRQIFSALQGGSELLARFRSIVRDVTINNYFSGSNPTPEQLQMLAGVISENTHGWTSDFFADAQCVPDVDIVESNLSLMRHAIKKAFELIFFADDGVFASEFGKHMRYWISMWVRLNQSLLRGGKKELVKLIKKNKHFQCGLAQQLLNAVEEVFKQPDGTPSLEFLLKLIASLYSGNQDEIDQFVLSEAPTLVDSDTNNALDDVKASDVNMETTSKMQEKSSDSAPRSSSGPIHANVGSSGSSENNWKKSVPEEWVETIAADGEAQQNMEPQLPFSDAYIAGMPASKRRKQTELNHTEACAKAHL